MRVVTLVRPDAATLGGGDVKMMVRLAEGLPRVGIQAELRAELAPDLTGVDLVHLCNLGSLPETLLQADHCRRHGVPYVITPNYYPTAEYWRSAEMHGPARWLRWLGGDRLERLKVLAKLRRHPEYLPAVLRALTGVHRIQAEILHHAAGWLPGCLAEGAQLRRDFPGIERPSWPLSPFGLEAVTPGAPPPGVPEGPFVLCAARLEANKNQMLLIEAVGGRYPIVLAGAINPRHRVYAERVLARLKAVGGVYLGPLSPESLWAVYRRARVHAQPSFYETAGLANLEAASQGCQIVCTDRGYARSFLGDLALYASPTDADAWRRAIDQAWKAPQVDWASHLAQYTWEQALNSAMKAYRCLLDRP